MHCAVPSSTCNILQHFQRNCKGCEWHVRLDLVIGHHKGSYRHLGTPKGYLRLGLGQNNLVEMGGDSHKAGGLACASQTQA